MDIIDRSDQPRSIEALEEALRQIEVSIIKDIFKLPPNLAIHLTVVREALIELISIRKVPIDLTNKHEAPYCSYCGSYHFPDETILCERRHS